MFVSMWVVFLLSGLVMAIVTIVWAIRSKQFDDQQRARFLPLTGLTGRELAAAPKKRHRAEIVGIWSMLIIGVSALGACLVLTLVVY